MENNNRPCYYISFDPTMFESGIDLIAVTENPAIEELAIRLRAQEEAKHKYYFNEERRIVAGPAIIPDKKIYRYMNGKEFDIVFEKQVVVSMVDKFNSEQRTVKFNIEHDSTRLVEGHILGSWIIEDSEKDKSSFYGFSLPVGTWFIEAKITDDAAWEYIKNMAQVGFSIEGLMQAIGLQLHKNYTQNMKFNSYQDVNKADFFVDGELVVGSFVYCEQLNYALINGVRSEIKYPFYDQTLEMEDGSLITIVNSQIVEIKQKNKTEMSKPKMKFFAVRKSTKRSYDTKTMKFAEVTTDSNEVLIVSALEEGATVEIVNEAGEVVAAANGEYMLPNEGVKITVADGKISTIEKMEEVAASSETAAETPATKLEIDPEVIAKLAELEARIEAIEAKLNEVASEEEIAMSNKEKFSKVDRLAYLSTLIKK